MENRYAEYELTADVLSIGERIKKGTFKPCLRTIPFSAITGGLKDSFGLSDIYAAGFLDDDYLKVIDEFKSTHIYSPRYVFEDVARVPLRIEFLRNVKGCVYVFLNGEEMEDWCKSHQEFEITMGAFKSKGFGRCHLRYLKLIENARIVRGELKTRIPEKYLSHFGIDWVIKPIYGYLFEPLDNASGKYVRAIFDGSIVRGYDFLVKEV